MNNRLSHGSKAILLPLLSGGLDSAIATFKSREVSGIRRLEPIFVDRGQTSLEAERKAYHTLADFFGIAVSDRFEYQLGFEWYKRQKKIDSGAYPYGRNLVLASVAAAHAATLHHGSSNFIIVGFTRDDVGDTTPEFVKSFNEMLVHGIENNRNNEIVKLQAPLIRMTKNEAIRWAAERGGEPLFGITWSCWKDESGGHCGGCLACRKRREAFVKAGVADPTRYVSQGPDGSV